jgi:hypothetical protein
MANVTFTPMKEIGIACTIRSAQGRSLALSGTLADVEPISNGHPAMVRNRALLHNLWSFGKFEKQYRVLRNREKRDSFAKQADAHKKVAVGIADLIDLESTSSHAAWCSACLMHTDHRKLTVGLSRLPAYLCTSCGSPTLRCAAPGCPHMATRGFGALQIPRYCAEHRHDIPGFEKANAKIGALEDYRDFLTFDKMNWALGSKVGGVVAAAGIVVGTGGLVLAPAIGGAIGTLVGGYTGAAATSYGLALLGGGSLAAGGLGMAGGTAVVAGLGGALGGGLGALVTTAYIGADKSFRIEKLSDGPGTPVIVASGFLTEGDNSWGDWEPIIRRRYPKSPVYRVHWGSKELGALAILVGGGIGKASLTFIIKAAAARASKAAAKKVIPGATAALLAADIARNPWHTAKVRADSTGVALAGLLARTDVESYILVGHSLGARAMVTTAQTLATKSDGPKVDTVHTLGAAIGAKGDWRILNDAVTNAVYNYYSTNDNVLKYLYSIAEAGEQSAGLRGFASKFPKIRDRNVSRFVNSHSDYCGQVKLV